VSSAARAAPARYHSPEDTVSLTISMQRIKVSLELIAATTYQVAREA